MPHECKLSIITINYNGLKDTCALIDTIPFDELPLEVIVVDNASKADEASLIEQHDSRVRVIRSQQNLGFAGGNNLGIQAARGEYLFLINNDTVLPSGNHLQTLIDRLASSPDVGMVCPKIRFAWGDNPIQFAGFTPLSPITVRNRAIGYGEQDMGQYDSARPTPYAHGAAMMLKREAIDKAGLMPECYFLYYEELDWSMMIARAGYAIWYDPAFTVLHKESKSTGQNSPLKTYYITRNRLLFVKRNISAPARYLSYAYLTCVVATRDLLVYAFKRKFSMAKAVLRGIGDFYSKH